MAPIDVNFERRSQIDCDQARALFIVAHAPDPLAKQAGHRLAYETLSELRSSYVVDTVVLCNSTAEQLEAARRCTRPERIVAYSTLGKLISILCGAVAGIPPRFSTRFSFRAINLVNKIMAAQRYSLVWLEFSQACWLLPWLLGKGKGIESVLSLHDLQIQVVERSSVTERTFFLKWTKCYEKKILSMANRARVLSQKDADLVNTYLKANIKVEVKRPTLSSFIASVRRSYEAVKPNSLIFWGAMDRPENHRAVYRFIQDVLPRLLSFFPSTSLFVVGANPPASLLALASDRIIVTGYIDNPAKYFEVASLGIVPLQSGAGVKLKTLEMLATGLTVVSTPIGAEGIDPSPYLIVTEFDTMAETIIDFWKSGAYMLPSTGPA